MEMVMILKRCFIVFLCCTSTLAQTKKPLPQNIDAPEQAQSELDKWAFPGIMGAGICFLLFWNNRSAQPATSKPQHAEPKPSEEPARPPQQPDPAPQKPEAEVNYIKIEPMDVGDILKQVTHMYSTKGVKEQPPVQFASPFTDEDKTELRQSHLSTIELPSDWDNDVPEIVIVADRRTVKHSYNIFSTLENAKDAQPLKDFFAAVEPS
jgi:hypothetical protein